MLKLWSISPTFYARLLRKFSYAQKVQTLYVSTKKLRMKLRYEKATRKMLVKLAPGLSRSQPKYELLRQFVVKLPPYKDTTYL
jgi:hypothetical protein